MGRLNIRIEGDELHMVRGCYDCAIAVFNAIVRELSSGTIELTRKTGSCVLGPCDDCKIKGKKHRRLPRANKDWR